MMNYTHSELRSRRLARSLISLAASCFVLWGCAPPTAMPPPVPMGDATWEAGLAGAQTTKWLDAWFCDPQSDSYSELSDECEGNTPDDPQFTFDGQAWGHRTLGDRWLLGATAFYGGSVAVGGGLYARVRFNDNPNFYIGTQLDSGLAWGRLGVPMSVRVGADVWLYTQPTIELSIYSSYMLPLGLSAAFGNNWHINAEANGRLNPRNTYVSNHEYSAGPTLRFALGASKRW